MITSRGSVSTIERGRRQPEKQRDVFELALVHDYLTQRGGAERVVASMRVAFPDAPVYTSLFAPETTFSDFGTADVRTFALNRSASLRKHHRAALPFLAPAFSRLRVEADVALCSSSGWAHGVQTTGRKIVYCHTPARWLYHSDVYLGEQSRGPKKLVKRWGLSVLQSRLRKWDGKAALTADRYLVNSTMVRDRVRDTYGLDAEVLHPCVAIQPTDLQTPYDHLDTGYWLCVSRLLPYKNVEAIVEAFAEMPNERLVIVGSGPQRERILHRRPANVLLTGGIDDSTLRWLYANCRALVTASYEDFGLVTLEANVFGKPVAVLRYGGFLDTVIDGQTGCFFPEPTPLAIRDAVRRVDRTNWSDDLIAKHSQDFSQDRFVERLREVVDEVRRQP